MLVAITVPPLSIRVTEKATVLGRSSKCDWRVLDATVSRQHARLRATLDGVWVEDLQSRNGTFINGQRIKRSLARPDHLIRFGDLAFRVLTTESDADSCLETKQAFCADAVCGRTDLGAPVLSPAQLRVFNLLFDGAPEKDIARQLGLSPHTVHNHIRNIFRAYGVHSRAELLAVALRTRQPSLGS